PRARGSGGPAGRLRPGELRLEAAGAAQRRAPAPHPPGRLRLDGVAGAGAGVLDRGGGLAVQPLGLPPHRARGHSRGMSAPMGTSAAMGGPDGFFSSKGVSVHASKLHKTYKTAAEDVHALRDLDWTVPPGRAL